MMLNIVRDGPRLCCRICWRPLTRAYDSHHAASCPSHRRGACHVKARDLIDRDRDGVDRPASERAILRAALSTHRCEACGVVDLCFYDIQRYGFFCSDECQTAAQEPRSRKESS